MTSRIGLEDEEFATKWLVEHCSIEIKKLSEDEWFRMGRLSILEFVQAVRAHTLEELEPLIPEHLLGESCEFVGVSNNCPRCRFEKMKEEK